MRAKDFKTGMGGRAAAAAILIKALRLPLCYPLFSTLSSISTVAMMKLKGDA